MKKVESIVRTAKLEDIVKAVEELDISGMSMSPIAGYGKQKGQDLIDSDIYEGNEIKFKEKLKIEIVVEDEKVDSLLDVLSEAARTDKIGDGKIFVYTVDQVLRIRTGEINNEAI
ncbi:P-II family nitrogen regulator [Halanaerobium salsuginis]|uniref:Nitrogen regulatory protein P-II family n=1 Tax=Halanaerobium salsuginis TaxID=29563 RepID=A0A1I4HHZ9_9FIRM|nr:P-II family nitrogen regulator [Halanaerobium salsuginis]SFL41744.1 nitrogen regulatory protein P-II family [Halanaerobium salsuginis]